MPSRQRERHSRSKDPHARRLLLVHAPETRAGVRVLTPPRVALIVERDPAMRSLQRYFLERAGLAVEFADDGPSALARAHKAPPAVVVTEILVPGLDGLTLCRRLREDAATAHVPVVVFSILAAATRAAEAGAQAFIRKPLVESSFVATVLGAIATQPPVITEQQWASR